MKYLIFLILTLSVISMKSQDDKFKYVRFKLECGHNEWKDSSFYARTNDKDLIVEIKQELNHPYYSRKHINGLIGYGNNGYNINGTFSFNWHFLDSNWKLSEFSIEVCDGCPFTDVHTNQSYWIDTIKQFCPWSGVPVEIIDDVVLDVESNESFTIKQRIIRNGVFEIDNQKINTKYKIFSIDGRLIQNGTINSNSYIDVSYLKTGIYYILINNKKKFIHFKVIILN